MARYRSGEITVHVDVSDVLDEICDDDLLEEVERRKLNKDSAIDFYDEARDAWYELKCGRVAEAAAILDRVVNPKWPSQARCAEQFAKRKSA